VRVDDGAWAPLLLLLLLSLVLLLLVCCSTCSGAAATIVAAAAAAGLQVGDDIGQGRLQRLALGASHQIQIAHCKQNEKVWCGFGEVWGHMGIRRDPAHGSVTACGSCLVNLLPVNNCGAAALCVMLRVRHSQLLPLLHPLPPNLRSPSPSNAMFGRLNEARSMSGSRMRSCCTMSRCTRSEAVAVSAMSGRRGSSWRSAASLQGGEDSEW